MRTSAWVTILGLAGLAVACGDQPTEVVPERESETPGMAAGPGTVAFATTTTEDGLTITTDKDDYSPGDTVWFTGSGWPANDVLDIVLNEQPETHPPHRWSVNVEADGIFQDSTYVVDEGDLNVAFTLVATSRSTGRSLSVTFTDGNLQSLALVPGTATAAPSGSAQYSINATMGGVGTTCTVTLTVSGLPSSLLASIPNNPVNATNQDFSRTLTITTTGATAGSYNFTVTGVRSSNCQGGGADPAVGGTLVVPAKIAFVTQPSTTVLNTNISPSVTVRFLDATNNPITTSTLPVTLAIGTNPAGGALTGTLTRNAVNGVATFNDLKIDKVGIGYTLTASSSTGITGATSNAFNITAGTASKLVFTSQPSGGAPNVPFPAAQQPKVQVQDAAGNVVTTSSASVTLDLVIPSGGPAGATLVCTNNPVNASSGLASFTGCKINLAGTGYKLRATSGSLTSAETDPFDIVNPDADAPEISCSVPNPALWYGANQNVPCTAGDAGSGLVNDDDASFTLSTDVDPGEEDATASTPSRNVCDKNGNCASAGPYQFKIDRKAPVVSCATADGDWHAADASVHCTATDGGSGVSPGDEGFDLTTSVAANTETANASTGTRNVTDMVGNSATAGPVAGNKVDKKAPAVTCGTADGSWHADNVSIHCTATDGGSGVESGDASFSLSTAVAADNETEDAQTDSREVADKVGNKATAGPIGNNKVDKKAPGYTCEAAPSAWSANDVTRKCVAADGGSGLTPASDASFNLHTTVPDGTETDDAQTNSKQLADAVGNKKTAGPLGNNKVDKKDPEVACDAADGNWHADNVSIHCTGSDGGSGLANGADASFNLVTNVPANTEDPNAPTDFRDVADEVGHTVKAGPVTGNKVDRKAPAVSCGNADGAWHANNVSIACTASDGGSGVAGPANFSLLTDVDDGIETSNASTGSRKVEDNVGNESTAGPVTGNKVDRKAPEVSCGTADAFWHKLDVSIACSASDGGSGLQNSADAAFSLSTNVPDGTETSEAATGSRPVPDAVGNNATAGPVGHNKIDKKGPTVALTCPASPLQLNQPVTTKWIATDGGSGVSGANVQNLQYPVPTSTVGGKTLVVAAGTAVDDVGNGSSVSNSCPYGVSFGFVGFATPVDNNNTLNGANSGQAIPLKWTLRDFNGAPVTTLSSVNVTAASLSCAQGTTTDMIEEYAAGSSGLINKGDGSYQFNWKTPTSYARSCKTLRLDLGEGTALNPVYHTALFEFKK